jgi:hypothetical protein
MEIKNEFGARSPMGDQALSGRGLRPRAPGKGLPPFAILCSWYQSNPEGDILTLLEKGHYNFAHKGDILTLP